jgi:two-component system sensor histidine kinase/response regulator
VNLRTRGIILSLLPLFITLILAIPEAVVQSNSSQAVARATHSDFLSEVAHDVEETSLDMNLAARNVARGQTGARLEYTQDLSKMNDGVARLGRLSAGDPETRKASIAVNRAAAEYKIVANALMANPGRANADRTFNSPTLRNFNITALELRQSVNAFDDIEHSDELTALAALEELWKTSFVLLAMLVALLALSSLLLGFYAVSAINAVMDLARKSERYSRGEPLGERSNRTDEIGVLDTAVHDLLTVQRERERELQRYRLLSEVTHDIILFIDRADQTIIDANAAALAAYGYPELIGQPTRTLHAPDDTFDDDMFALSDRPEGLVYEGLHQRADGSVFPVEVYMHSAEIEGRPTIIMTIRDISERRFAAEQVALALDQAIEASRVKSEFVATMSHEIRTPMHGVIGMSELLLETQLMPVQREYATTVKESAQALLTIIDDILDFSKLEAHKMELEAVAFDPATVVAGVINLVRGTARDKGLGLRALTSAHVPAAVCGDPTRVRQVLLNLVGNAVKFTTNGEVSVATSVESDNGRTVVLAFAVSDTGIGVNPEARERLFEAFVQGDGSTTRRFGGTGLGLSICRSLVELMGGRIWLGEHAGPGATFCFTASFERTTEVVAPAILAAGALRVLVLDDDKATRQSFEATLRAWGMHNASAPDVDSARSQLRAAALSGSPFDVVLIDYVLPLMDGIAFATEIAAKTGEYGAPARILVTAFDAEGRKGAALAAGCASYLPKPIDPSQLYDALGGIDRDRRASTAALGNGSRNARILLAEDSALIRRVAHFQLAELQYSVDIVENGEQAVAAVAGGNYELVLMDMRMPEMDGLDATRAIRETELSSGRHIVVVALTANVLEDDRKACVDAGMDDFLAKPLKLHELRTVLERWLPALV